MFGKAYECFRVMPLYEKLLNLLNAWMDYVNNLYVDTLFLNFNAARSLHSGTVSDLAHFWDSISDVGKLIKNFFKNKSQKIQINQNNLFQINQS